MIVPETNAQVVTVMGSYRLRSSFEPMVYAAQEKTATRIRKSPRRTPGSRASPRSRRMRTTPVNATAMPASFPPARPSFK